MSKEITLHHGEKAIVDDEDYEYLSSIKWYLHHKGYVRGIVKVDGKYKNVAMHRIVINAPDGFQVDHINHNKVDNRKSNLRICTNRGNMMNREIQNGSKSGYKGVTRKKNEKNWRARIKVNGKLIQLGQFSDPSEAARVYDDAAKEYFGEFAYLNFPERVANGERWNV